jgi:hypothetical protein
MSPPRLDHSYLGVGKEMNATFEQVRLRDKICIENANEVAVRGLESTGEGSSLESGSIDPVN